MSTSVDHDEKADVLYVYLVGRRARVWREDADDSELVVAFDEASEPVGLTLIGATQVSSDLWRTHPWRTPGRPALPPEVDEAVAAWIRAYEARVAEVQPRESG